MKTKKNRVGNKLRDVKKIRREVEVGLIRVASMIPALGPGIIQVINGLRDIEPQMDEMIKQERSRNAGLR